MKYWQKRNLQTQAAIANKSAKDINKQLTKYYNTAVNGVIKDFEATYDKLLATVEAGKEPTPADLYKLNKYWEMQGQLKKELQKLGDKEIALLSEQFVKTFKADYEAIMLGADIEPKAHYNKISTEAAEQVINSVWVADGKSWSERIWDNTSKLADTLNEELIHCVVTGKKTSQLKKLLQDRFNASHAEADRLARTEIAHIQTAAAKKRYEDYGIQEVEIWADKDERRCEVCGKLHKKRYPVGAAVPIPAHPNCRCCIIPVVEDEPKTATQATAPQQQTPQTIQAVPNIESEKRAFSPAQTKQEAEDTAELFGIEADYSQFDISVANAVNETLFEVVEIFGENALDCLKVIRNYKKGEGTGAGGYSFKDGSLKLTNVRGKDALQRQLANLKKFPDGYFSTYDERHLIRHEIGHAIHDSAAFGGMEKEIRELQKLRTKEIEKSGGNPYRDVSGYAQKDHYEFIAECVADYLGGNPQASSIQVVELLRDRLRKKRK